MVWIPPGETRIGDDGFFPEERPVRTVHVEGFWISAHAVTNGEFARFAEATGYVTLAEREGPDTGGGAVFGPGLHVRDWSDIRAWWRFEPTASWRQPRGAGGGIDARAAFPVVQIAYEDALAYARWRGHDLPGEAEWERAARGGLDDAPYAWGAQPRPDGVYMANHWQGAFPFEDSGADGFAGLAPVGCFPPNGYGLYDMTGNVWEWTKDRWEREGLRIIKGGSFLCSDTYCHRYRPAARQPGDETFSTEHLGFRTVWRGPPPP
ncbi:MAG: formylglycine-generating enzyme family protein [Oceanicaulis sp.]|nr:formylglycine-generating enzyme family protein [Oceanicaulis sp.]